METMKATTVTTTATSMVPTRKNAKHCYAPNLKSQLNDLVPKKRNYFFVSLSPPYLGCKEFANINI